MSSSRWSTESKLNGIGGDTFISQCFVWDLKKTYLLLIYYSFKSKTKQKGKKKKKKGRNKPFPRRHFRVYRNSGVLFLNTIEFICNRHIGNSLYISLNFLNLFNANFLLFFNSFDATVKAMTILGLRHFIKHTICRGILWVSPFPWMSLKCINNNLNTHNALLLVCLWVWVLLSI